MKFCPIKDFSHVTRCAWLAFCTCRERRPPAGGLGALGNRHTGTPLPSFFSELSWGPEGLGGALRAPIYDALHWGAVGQLFQFIPPSLGPQDWGIGRFWVLLSLPHGVLPLSRPPCAGGITWPWHSGTEEHQSGAGRGFPSLPGRQAQVPHIGETLFIHLGSTRDVMPTHGPARRLLKPQLLGEPCSGCHRAGSCQGLLLQPPLDTGSFPNTMAYRTEHCFSGHLCIGCSCCVLVVMCP